ncbi:MAG: phosphoenolpyruvate--protein phosphotransferase [Candidatus Cloacimonadota bacterium]|nr:phosphoenolpyruvate--protein phosphotransferase [Candidatus Cloacimonadota bacterium]
MKKIKGNSVSSGVAIGKAKIIKKHELYIERKKILKREVKLELSRFKEDVEFVVNELDKLIQDFTYSQENRDILESHKMILKDPHFNSRITELISKELHSLEHAISTYFTEAVDIFSNMNNSYLSHRVNDFEDIAYRLLSHIMDERKDILVGVDENSILLMENISPSFVTKVFDKNIQGLCTERGSRNSHSSIIARSMNLPMLVNTLGLLGNIKDGEDLIIDGNDGYVIISPTKKVLEKYQAIYKEEQNVQKELLKLIDVESITKDGKEIKLMSNIEIPQEIDQVIKYNSAGIGLFRTEFLFMDREDLPTEEEQYKIYKNIAEQCKPNSVIIRTIDVGGDKLSNILNITHEENPNLGYRGIRISLQNVPIFKQQIKAILRANIHGNIKIMFPMISGVDELLKVKEIIEICSKELINTGIAFNANMELGAMIEIPSAVITSDSIAEECDFLSIGTNDLIQYTLAVDRDNQSISEYYKPLHPAVIRSLKMTIDNAHKMGKKVAVCGEMASEKKYVKLLLALGVDELSVSPGRLLIIKKEIIDCDITEMKSKLDRILACKTSKEIDKLL